MNLPAPFPQRIVRLGWVILGVITFATVGAQPSTAPVGAVRNLAERQPLVVGASNDGFPYSYFNERGEPDGFAAEVFDAVARTMKLRAKRVSRPGIALYAGFRQGEFDLLQLYSQTVEREAYTEFSVPLLTLQGAVFVRRGGPIHAFEDLNGAEFVIVGAGSIGEQFLRDRGLHPRVRQVASTAEALRLIEAGECAATFITQLTAQAIIGQKKLREVVMLGQPVDGYDVRHCFAVHRGDAQLLARLNEGLAILHGNGEFDRIYRKWFGRLGGVLFTREEVATFVAAALALVCAVALWTGWRQREFRRRIEQLNGGLERRVAERTAELTGRTQEAERLARELRASQQETEQMTARLTRSNADLVSANQDLEAFSYSVSHDLRTPLRNIGGFLELLTRRAGDKFDKESARFVSVVAAEAARMGTLIDDLLAFSRIGRAELKAGPVALGELVDEVRQELAPQTERRIVEWRVGPLPTVSGDRALLRVVLVNLLGNAVKFTRQRPVAVIEVGVMPPEAGESAVTVFVRDNGAGFNPKYADKLFGVFQRLHNQRDFEGTGIGLANVQRIVTRHSGRVWAEGSVDNGAVFYFKLNLYPT
jgi:signal transduction histidine kinase